MNDQQRRSALQQAGHAVCALALGLMSDRDSIVADDEIWNRAVKSGEFPDDEGAEALMRFAPEEFWIRTAAICYAGAAALRRARHKDWRECTTDDFRWAALAIRRITGDQRANRHLVGLAQRRAGLLVEHYWPEVRAVAAALLSAKTLRGDRARDIWCKSLTFRKALVVTW